MSFQDNEKNSVQSLLALLRSTQDGPSSSTPESTGPTSSAGHVPDSRRTLGRHGSGSGSGHVVPAGAASIARGNSGAAAVPVPSQQQLNDLIRSLNGSDQSHASGPIDTATPSPYSTDTTDKPSRTLIQPFGPVATAVPISPSGSRRISDGQIRRGSNTDTAGISRGQSSEISMSENGGESGALSFAKCLPKLSALMSDQGFMRELRSMKADQDALERRLWAKQEKVKADHERTLQAERDIARISQRPISSAKRAQWAADLELNLQDFQRQTCIPSLDSLSQRHRARLVELGVPGLGGDTAEEGTLERWRRIMDLLQAGLEE